MNKEPVFAPKKDYFAPMHTAEHILNQTMVRLFGCGRSFNAHIEKNKSKCDYRLSPAPSPEDLARVEAQVNEVIARDLPVTARIMPRARAAVLADLSKLPADAGDELRMVFVGDYDVCPCIGKHVENTSEIGRFKLSGWDWRDGTLRIRFKLEN